MSLCHLPALLHRSKHPQMLLPANNCVLKCPAAVSMTTRGEGKGVGLGGERKQDVKKEKVRPETVEHIYLIIISSRKASPAANKSICLSGPTALSAYKVICLMGEFSFFVKIVLF